MRLLIWPISRAGIGLARGWDSKHGCAIPFSQKRQLAIHGRARYLAGCDFLRKPTRCLLFTISRRTMIIERIVKVT